MICITPTDDDIDQATIEMARAMGVTMTNYDLKSTTYICGEYMYRVSLVSQQDSDEFAIEIKAKASGRPTQRLLLAGSVSTTIAQSMLRLSHKPEARRWWQFWKGGRS